MAVVLPNTMLTARRKEHQFKRDAHGASVPSVEWSDPSVPLPGALVIPEGGEQSNVPWRIRADLGLLPLLPEDELTTADGRTFIVRTVKPVVVPDYPDVDYLAVTAELDPPYSP